MYSKANDIGNMIITKDKNLYSIKEKILSCVRTGYDNADIMVEKLNIEKEYLVLYLYFLEKQGYLKSIFNKKTECGYFVKSYKIC